MFFFADLAIPISLKDTLSLTQFHLFFQLGKYLRPIIYPESILYGWVSKLRSTRRMLSLSFQEIFRKFATMRKRRKKGTELGSPACPMVWMASSIICENFHLLKMTMTLCWSWPASHSVGNESEKRRRRRCENWERRQNCPKNISADERKKHRKINVKRRWATTTETFW